MPPLESAYSSRIVPRAVTLLTTERCRVWQTPADAGKDAGVQAYDDSKHTMTASTADTEASVISDQDRFHAVLAVYLQLTRLGLTLPGPCPDDAAHPALVPSTLRHHPGKRKCTGSLVAGRLGTKAAPGHAAEAQEQGCPGTGMPRNRHADNLSGVG